jgi:EAL domain-containing protein (putative c-di-GMP-specific phosphodiesterase class I)/CheY-like chemotaxis protein
MKPKEAHPVPNETLRVLLIDDDDAFLRAYKKALGVGGCVVETAANGAAGLEKIDATPFDVVVSDVAMPGLGGLEFLQAVRRRDLDVPVILITGEPNLDSAARATEYGAFRYLVKPVEPKALQDVIRVAGRLHRMAELKRQAFVVAGLPPISGDRVGLEGRFVSALERLWMAYQPVVSWKNRAVFGYEALLRSAEPSLPSPPEILDAAERLGRLRELGRAIRQRVATDAAEAPPDALLFVNLHAADLVDDMLYDPAASLGKIAARVVLEITERASLDVVANVEPRIAKLKQMGFRLAVDDLGAGYAGLTSFTKLEPAIAKIDMSLVRGIDAHPQKQSIVRSVVRLCEELGMLVVAEGVETPAERNTLVELGCDLLQGYLFARPERGFRPPAM